MGIGVKVTACNGGCRSCYEETIRGNGRRSYNIKEILKSLKAGLKDKPEYSVPSLHGGEPLLMRFKDIELILKTIFNVKGYTSIQTGGGLVTQKHIELFKKYKTSVGVSLDGDTAQLNRGRWNKPGITDQMVERETKRTIDNILKLKEAGLSVSIISVLRKYNAGRQNLSEFIRFLYRMYNEFNIIHIRTNPGIVFKDEYKEDEELTTEELSRAFLEIAVLTFSNPDIHIRPIRDVTELLTGKPQSGTCIFTECDPFRTESEIPILEDGMYGACLKSGAGPDGVTSQRADVYSRSRYSLLEQIDEGSFGCKDCKYWSICRGGCPGEGVNNDWRNRSRFCESFKILYQHVEKYIRGLFPNIWLTTDGVMTRQGVLKSLSDSVWEIGKGTTLEDVTKDDKPKEKKGSPHGDSPHGDGYGDSNRPESLKDPQNNKMRPLK